MAAQVGWAAPLDFARDIRPMLSDACYNCHGPDGKARKGKLRLDDRVGALESGVLADGEMLKRLTSTDPDLQMPPPDSNRNLSDANRAKLMQWLKAGAKWPEDDRHWAFVPPKQPAVPKVKAGGWVRNPIDAFVLARLEREGLNPSLAADKATLLRRVTFDLTGLPPTIAERVARWPLHDPMQFRLSAPGTIGSRMLEERACGCWATCWPIRNCGGPVLTPLRLVIRFYVFFLCR